MADDLFPWENGPPAGRFDDLVDEAFGPPPSAPESSSDDDSADSSDDIDRAPDGESPSFATLFAGLQALSRVAIVSLARVKREAQRPIVYAWDRIVERGLGQVVGIVGPPGHGKSELLRMLCAARAQTGEAVHVLGHHVEPAAPEKFIVVIQDEHGASSEARHQLRSFAMVGADEAGLDRVIIVARKNVTVGDPVWQEIGKLVASGFISDLFLDSLARVARADANDEQAQAVVFEEIHRMIESAPGDEKPIVWLVAHTTKKRDGDVTLSDMSGSAQRVAQLDVGIVVNGRKDASGKVLASRVVFERLREEPEDRPEPVEFTIKREDDGFTCVLGNARPKDDRPLEERILDLLSTGPKTKNAIRTSLGRNDSDIESAIDALFAARRIVTTSQTVRGKSFKAFRLSDDISRTSTPYVSPDSPRRPYLTGRTPDEARQRSFSDG